MDFRGKWKLVLIVYKRFTLLTYLALAEILQNVVLILNHLEEALTIVAW